MKKLIYALTLSLLMVGTSTAQSFFDITRPQGAVYQGLRSYNIGLSIPGGFAFDKSPTTGVSASQSIGVSLGYTTVFADLGKVAVSSESEVLYRTITEIYADNTSLRRANVQGLTGLGLYYNIGENFAIYGKGLLGVNTDFSSRTSSAFSDLFKFEVRAGALYSLGRHLSIFGETGYGQDILRLGITIK